MDPVITSFGNAGFQDCSGGWATMFARFDLGITAELVDEEQGLWQIEVDGIDTDEVNDFAKLQLDADPSCFGARLVEWTTAQRSEEPGFVDGAEEEDPGNFLDYLPKPSDLGVVEDRPLTIITWGKALMKNAPADSQFNFNAGILNGRGGGADLRTMNGLSAEVQANVASCSLFPRWLEMLINKVEQSSPAIHTISINCTKGRHRSVAAAEILKKYYYKQAVVQHRTIR